MNRLIYYLFVMGIISLFLLSGPVLNLLGWSFVPGPYGDTGSIFTRIHPATYIFGLASGVALLSFQRRYWDILRNPFYCLFLFATLVVIGRAIFISASSADGMGGGELSTAIVSFGTVAAMIFCIPSERRDIVWLSFPLRLFFVTNSLIAITERLVGYRFIPSFLDMSTESRSTALLGHPLNGALLTGLVLINLILLPRKKIPLPLRLLEITINILAMIAYGGRAALVFLPVVIASGALFLRNRKGEEEISFIRRLMPIALIGIGMLLLTLPIPFIESTLTRFYEDNGSSITRSNAIKILLSLDYNSLIYGVDVYNRKLLMSFYNTNSGIELSWISLVIIFGLPVVLFLAAGMLGLLWKLCKSLDQSAKIIVLYFLVITAGSVGFSSKSVVIAQLIGIMIILCQQQGVRAAVRPLSDAVKARSSPPQPRR